jgi:hypothetical protein
MIFLVFEGNELEIHGYLDINSQSYIDYSKSQLEYIFTLNENTVSWKNFKKKKTTSDFTTETEYISAFEVAKNAIWIKKFIIKLGVVPSIVDLVVLYYDNNEVITQSKKPRSHQRSKHVIR